VSETISVCLSPMGARRLRRLTKLLAKAYGLDAVTNGAVVEEALLKVDIANFGPHPPLRVKADPKFPKPQPAHKATT